MADAHQLQPGKEVFADGDEVRHEGATGDLLRLRPVRRHRRVHRHDPGGKDGGSCSPYPPVRHIETITRQPCKWRIGNVIGSGFFLLVINSMSLYSMWNIGLYIT